MKRRISAPPLLLALAWLSLVKPEYTHALETDTPSGFAGQRIVIHSTIIRNKSPKKKEASGYIGRSILQIHPLDPELDMERIRSAVRDASYDRALHILQPYLLSPREYPRFYSDYLVLLVWTGELDEAVRKFSHLPEPFPKRIYLLLNMARAYHELGRYRDSCRLYRQVLRQDPGNGQAFHGLVTDLLLQNKPSEAEQIIANHYSAGHDTLLHRLALARLSFSRGHFLDALTIYHAMAREFGKQKYLIDSQLEKDIRNLSPADRDALVTVLAKKIDDQDKRFLEDYLLTLILDGRYGEATTLWKKKGGGISEYDNPLKYWLGWACFKTGDIHTAKTFFHQLLPEPQFTTSGLIALSYCYAREGDGTGALTVLARLPENDINVLFARAYVLERQKRFWEAIHTYDRILDNGDNSLASRLRILALGALGCSSRALEQADRLFPDNRELRLSLLGDQAMYAIRWQEPARALHLLQQLLVDSEQPRFRFDTIIALVDENRMTEAVALYEQIAQIQVPYWIRDKVAKAYLYLERPHRALELYNSVLREQPQYFNARMGKLYTLLELRQWRQADQLLLGLEHDIPRYRFLGSKKEPNPEWMEVILGRGWWYGYQDRLAEAETFLNQVYRQAPANTELRNILAHIHYWRGWHRKAGEEFAILHSLDPDFVAAETGRILVLNETGRKILARNLAHQLLAEHPTNKHVQRINRQFQVEDMREIVVDSQVYREQDDSTDLRLQTTFKQPLSPWTRLYGSWLWNEVKDQDLLDVLNRIGFGLEHTFSASWKGIQQFSAGLEGRGTPASLTRIIFTPDDHWTLSMAYDTYSLDLPARARVRGIDADRYDLAFQYRWNESRRWSLQVTHSGFDDGNRRTQLFLGLEEGLLVRHDWRATLGLDLYTSSNTREDAPYFNPSRDFSTSLTLLTEQTIRRIYQTSFVHRLSLTGGLYAQEDFGVEPLWNIRYEQEYDFSDVHALLVGGSWSNRAYDGSDTSSFSIDFTYRYHF